MTPNPPYDARRDLAPVTMLASVPYLLLVRNTLSLNTVKDPIAQARQHPGTLNYGFAGCGCSAHLATALFASMAGIQVVHVPYKGSAPAATDLVGGQIQFVFEAIGAGMQYVKSGRLRALGVSTVQRSQTLLELATIAEQGVPGYKMSTRHTVCTTCGTPAPIIDKLNREIVAVVNTPAVREKFTAAGIDPQSSTPGQLAAPISQAFPRWHKLLTQLGLHGR